MGKLPVQPSDCDGGRGGCMAEQTRSITRMFSQDKKTNIAIFAALVALCGLLFNLLGGLERAFRIPARVEALEKADIERSKLQQEFYQFRAEVQTRVQQIENSLSRVQQQQSEALGELRTISNTLSRLQENVANMKEGLTSFKVYVDERLAEKERRNP